MLQDELDQLLAQRIIPPVEKLSQSAALSPPPLSWFEGEIDD